MGKIYQKTSSSHNLIGGLPQGSLIGQLLYIIGSDDVAAVIEEEDKFKYIDDLAVLDAIDVKGKLKDYDVWQHVPSDIATEERFLAASAGKSQDINNSIAAWTLSNKMKINEDKSKYMVLSKSKEKFATRLTINSKTLDRAQEMVHLGVWLTEDMSWNKHMSEMCRRAYPRVKMLSKPKYVGTSTEDLIELYCLLIRSLTEYCSVVFHSSLTLRLRNKIEAIQKTCLRVILGEMYVDYESALEMCGLQKLDTRRENRSLQFALHCLKNEITINMFPHNPSTDTHELRNREKFKVNRSYTKCYKKSTIPYLQGRLNTHFSKVEEASRE